MKNTLWAISSVMRTRRAAVVPARLTYGCRGDLDQKEPKEIF